MVLHWPIIKPSLEKEMMRNYCDFFCFFYLLAKNISIYYYHGDIKAVFIFVLGLLSNPAKEEEREF
jgi:hypothetical protein